ncbi:MAG TPA: hypothetical protein PKW21_06650 [Rhabdaerophilum sp.]|nr:hypothetical protein [Rhabdaerophilum sp.]
MNSIKVIGVLCVLMAGTFAARASCAANFTQEGVPLVTGITYKSWVLYPGLDSKLAFKNLHRAVVAEGFEDVQPNAGLGTISAVQETSGSGREQLLRISVRKSGNGTRVTGTFLIQAGQLASADSVRSGLCGILDSAR